MARLIFHIDVNSAFLSWEATRRVSLREEVRYQDRLASGHCANVLVSG